MNMNLDIYLDIDIFLSKLTLLDYSNHSKSKLCLQLQEKYCIKKNKAINFIDKYLNETNIIHKYMFENFDILKQLSQKALNSRKIDCDKCYMDKLGEWFAQSLKDTDFTTSIKRLYIYDFIENKVNSINGSIKHTNNCNMA